MYFSCKKDSNQPSITGQWRWTIQYTDNPAYNSTPQSTGIQETLSFTENGMYALTQNGIIKDAGTYRNSTTKSVSGQSIPSIFYTNSRVSDSVSYYSLTGNNDTLFFSHDLIGTDGSGARYYVRQ